MLKSKSWLALVSVENVGPKRVKLLLDRFGTIDQIFSADLVDIARLPKFNPLLANRILQAGKNIHRFERQLKFLKEKEIMLLCLNDPDYPDLLKKSPNPPPVLCRKGTMDSVPDKPVAIVGTRSPTDQGILTAVEISSELASAGFTIVSGLAKGIDTAAHFGALEANGTTIGVLGCPLWTIYPKENRQLASRICDNGMLLSEHPFPAEPTSANLISRNRIISGLSICVIVVETEVPGGAIRTVEFARKQGRKCYVYNGSQKGHPLISGNEWLIANGANEIHLSELPNLIAKLKQEVVSSFRDDQMELF